MRLPLPLSRRLALAGLAGVGIVALHACRTARPADPADPTAPVATIRVTRGSIKLRAERAAAAPPFWLAIALVDPAAAERGATSTEEKLFATGFRELTDGRFDEALVVFGSLDDSADPTMRTAARTGQTLILQAQGRWSAIADLEQDEDRATTADRASIFRWARAFAALPPATIRVTPGTTRLPLGLSTAGTPVVRVRVNGHERYFWLDTGASISIVAGDVARDLGVTSVGTDTLAMATWGGRVSARVGLVDRLELGPLDARGVPVAILEDWALQLEHRRRPGEADASVHLDGVIGTDLLRHLALTFDVRAGELTLARPPRRSPDARPRRNLFWLGFPVVRLTSGSGRPALLGIDTGADSSMVGESWFLVDSAGQLLGRRGTLVGLGATSVATLQAVQEVVLSDGAYTVRLRGVTVAPDRHSTFVTMDGVLGSDFIRSAVVHVDLTNGLFSLRPPGRRAVRDAISVTSP